MLLSLKRSCGLWCLPRLRHQHRRQSTVIKLTHYKNDMVIPNSAKPRILRTLIACKSLGKVNESRYSTIRRLTLVNIGNFIVWFIASTLALNAFLMVTSSPLASKLASYEYRNITSCSKSRYVKVQFAKPYLTSVNNGYEVRYIS